MKLNKTKIVATLGPASSSTVMLKKLLKAGVDVFRVNFSHASYIETASIIRSIRKLSIELKIHVSILGDLQGPKIRLGLIKEKSFLNRGDVLEITTKSLEMGDEKYVSILGVEMVSTSDILSGSYHADCNLRQGARALKGP